MNETRRRIRRLCVMISGVCLIFLTMRAYAANGVIELQLEDLKSQYSDRSGVVLILYQVGEVSAYGEPSIDQIYGITRFPHSAEETKKAVEQIMAKRPGEPLRRQKTDADGKLTFSGLDNGVYLICAESSEKYGIISPILTVLPYYEVVDGEKTGPLYSLKVQPKASKPDVPEPSTESETESESEPQSESETEPETGAETESETSTESGGSSGTGGSGGYGGSGGSGGSVKTGDDSNVIGYLMLFITAGAMVVLLMRRKGKGASE